jgi:hypothetical protein
VVQSQYEEVRSGINTRGLQEADICSIGSAENKAPGLGSCLVTGKIIQFSPGSPNVTISYLVADSVDSNKTSGDLEAIKKSKPRVTNIAQESQQIQWSSTFVGGVRLDGADSNITAIAIIRSPVSSSIVVYALAGVVPNDLLSTATPDVSTALVVKNTGNGGAPGGAVCVNIGSSSASVNTVVPLEPVISSINVGELEAQCRR